MDTLHSDSETSSFKATHQYFATVFKCPAPSRNADASLRSRLAKTLQLRSFELNYATGEARARSAIETRQTTTPAPAQAATHEGRLRHRRDSTI